MQAVAREFVRCDVVADVAALGGVGERVSDQVVQLLLRLGDLGVLVQDCREFGAVCALVSCSPLVDNTALFGSLRAELAVTVDAGLTVQQAHHIAHDVEHHLVHTVPRLTAATVHTEPAAHAQAAHDTLAHHRRSHRPRKR